MTLDTKALEACPHCGSDAELQQDGRHYFAKCLDAEECGAEGPRALVDAYAVETWNRRATNDASAQTEPVAYLHRSRPCLPVQFPREWRADPKRHGLTPLYTATPSRNDILEEATRPFVEFADNNIDAEGWAESRCERDRICDWFGPSDFRAIRALVKP